MRQECCVHTIQESSQMIADMLDIIMSDFLTSFDLAYLNEEQREVLTKITLLSSAVKLGIKRESMGQRSEWQ